MNIEIFFCNLQLNQLKLIHNIYIRFCDGLLTMINNYQK